MKPYVRLVHDHDRTVLNLLAQLGLCMTALYETNQREAALQMREQVMAQTSYAKSLAVMREYCEVGSV